MKTIIDMEYSRLSGIDVESPESHYVRMAFDGRDPLHSVVMYLKTEDAYELCQCLKEVVDAQ